MQRFNALSRNGKIGVGCLGLILLSVACSICSTALTAVGIIDPPTPVPTATITATPTITPTDEPEPTATERPTDDPVAEAVRDYMAWAAPLTAQLGKTMSEMTTTLGQAGESPAVILTQEWRERMSLQLALLSAAADVIRTKPQSEIPEPVAKLHGQMLELAGKLDTISTNLASGIDEVDAAKIAVANEAMASVSPLTAEMSAEIDALGEKYGTD